MPMRYEGGFGKCRSCGKQIIWIRLPSGRHMPCDPAIVTYMVPADGSGKDKIVTPYGEVISAKLVNPGTPGAASSGYISHFATCPNGNMHRKKR